MTLYIEDAYLSYSTNINDSLLNITQVMAPDSNLYSKVDIENLYTIGEAGEPSLPVKLVRLYIPEGKDVDYITFSKHQNPMIYNLQDPIFPIQPDPPISIDSLVPEFTPPDSVIYSSYNAWPDTMVKMDRLDFFNGYNQIATIIVLPFQYFPQADSLIYYSTISITVNLKQSTNGQVIYPNQSVETQSFYNDILHGMVDNPQDITTTTQKSSKLPKTLPVYEYVVITDDSHIGSFAGFCLSGKTE